MEIEAAVRKHLLKQSSIKNLVQDRVWKFKLEESIEGTGRGAIIVMRRTGWTKPGFNSQEYPMLAVEMVSDFSRDDDMNVLDDDRETRVMQLYREVDRILHQVDREYRTWPENDDDGLIVLGSFRGSEPTEPTEKYGCAVVRVTYDVQVVHAG